MILDYFGIVILINCFLICSVAKISIFLTVWYDTRISWVELEDIFAFDGMVNQSRGWRYDVCSWGWYIRSTKTLALKINLVQLNFIIVLVLQNLWAANLFFSQPLALSFSSAFVTRVQWLYYKWLFSHIYIVSWLLLGIALHSFRYGDPIKVFFFFRLQSHL